MRAHITALEPKKQMQNNTSESEDTHQKYSQVVLCRSLAQAKILKHKKSEFIYLLFLMMQRWTTYWKGKASCCRPVKNTKLL